MKLKGIFVKAQNEKFALGAFNASNLETIRAIVQAAKKLSSPVIVEASPGEVEFIGIEIVASILHTWQENLRIPLFLNLDHGRDPNKIKEAVDLGFDLVHFDGSNLPFEENIGTTRELVESAHAQGVLVEGEVDKIPEHSIAHTEAAWEVAKGLMMTDPDKALEFVKKTGVDILAVFVGNLHGVYTTPPVLDFERLEQLRKKLPCFLSLHGGSGINSEDIKKAIEIGGIVKINVNTELRLAFRSTLDEVLAESEEIVWYKIAPEIIDSVQKVVERKIEMFGSGKNV